MTYSEQLHEAQNRFATHVSYLIGFIQSPENGFKISFGRAYDIPEVQPILVEKGLSNALSGKHQERLAIDLNLFLNGYYLFSDKAQRERDMQACKPVFDYWLTLHPKNRCGAYFTTIFDPYHYETGI